MTKHASAKASKAAKPQGRSHLRNLAIGVLPMQAIGMGAGAGLGRATGGAGATGLYGSAGLGLGTLASMYSGDKAYAQLVKDKLVPARTLAAMTGAAGQMAGAYSGTRGFTDYGNKDELIHPMLASGFTGGLGLGYGMMADTKDYLKYHGDVDNQVRIVRRMPNWRGAARSARRTLSTRAEQLSRRVAKGAQGRRRRRSTKASRKVAGKASSKASSKGARKSTRKSGVRRAGRARRS